MARASRPAAVANAGRALELKRLRVNDNDGGGDGDGNHADEGGSDDMMNKRMMVMMTTTAMRVTLTITTMNDGAGDSDIFWLELVDARLSPARGTHAARSETHVHEAKRTHAEPNKSSCKASAHPLPDNDQRARGSARSHIRIATRHSTLSTSGLCKHPPSRKIAFRSFT